MDKMGVGECPTISHFIQTFSQMTSINDISVVFLSSFCTNLCKRLLRSTAEDTLSVNITNRSGAMNTDDGLFHMSFVFWFILRPTYTSRTSWFHPSLISENFIIVTPWLSLTHTTKYDNKTKYHEIH